MQSSECMYICDQFTDYHENTLAQDIRAKVDTHLSICSKCQTTFSELAQMLKTMNQLPSISTTPDFTDNLMQKIQSTPDQTPMMRFFTSGYTRVAGYAVAAGLVVALGLNVWLDPVSAQKSLDAPKFATDGTAEPEQSSSFAAAPDSATGSVTDSLEATQTIQTPNQKLQLVSDNK